MIKIIHTRFNPLIIFQEREHFDDLVGRKMAAASVMLSSVTLGPANFTVEKTAARGLPSLTIASPTSLRIVASGVKKIKTNKPYGVNGSMDLRNGVDASGRKGKGYGVYKFVDKYGANVDGYRLWAPLFPNVKSRFMGKCLRTNPMKSLASCSARIICSAVSSSSQATLPSALLFDCDGVLVDTEKDGHRISFNDTFKERELGVTWDVDLYGELLKIGGGKERMTAYFNKVGWPEKAPKEEAERKVFIAGLHKQKTELFMVLIEKKLLPLRPGVAKLIDQALSNGVKVAVCSTSNEKAVSAIVSCLLGPERAEKIKIFAGDVVPKKKPDPAIYNLAAETLGVDPSKCVVVEDSAIGLAAAKAAGMTCIVTKSGYTADEDFVNADAVFDCIGDPPNEKFDLAFCGSLLQKQFLS